MLTCKVVLSHKHHTSPAVRARSVIIYNAASRQPQSQFLRMGNRPSTYINIALDKPSYLPGEEVKGYVEVKSKEPLPCSILDVHVSGQAFSKLEVRDPKGTIHDRVLYQEEKTVLDQSICVANCATGSFAPGHYQLPFSVQLPDDVPPSCHDYDAKDKSRKIRNFGASYQVAAKLQQPGDGTQEDTAPVLLRTVYLNVDSAPPTAPGEQKIENKKDKASDLTGYGLATGLAGMAVPVMELVFTGQTRILKDKMRNDSGDFTFEDVTLSNNVLVAGHSVKLEGTLYNNTDATQAKIQIDQTARVSAESGSDRFNQFRQVFQRSIPIRPGKTEFSTDITINTPQWAPNPSTKVLEMFEISYNLEMQAMSGYQGGIMKALTSSRPSIRFPVTVVRAGHGADTCDWAEGKVSDAYEEPKTPNVLGRLGNLIGIARPPPPPPPETRFAPAPYKPDPEKYLS